MYIAFAKKQLELENCNEVVIFIKNSKKKKVTIQCINQLF